MLQDDKSQHKSVPPRSIESTTCRKAFLHVSILEAPCVIFLDYQIYAFVELSSLREVHITAVSDAKLSAQSLTGPSVPGMTRPTDHRFVSMW